MQMHANCMQNIGKLKNRKFIMDETGAMHFMNYVF